MDPIVNEIHAENPETVNLKNLIRNHAQKVQQLSDQLKEKRDLLTENLENNEAYSNADEKLQDATDAKKVIKLQLLTTPELASLDQEIKDLRFDLKESKQTLSDLLINYRDQTSATQLELLNGTVGIINLSAKIKRK